MQTNISAELDGELGAGDLGPLAWVLDELRKSLDGATKALRRFVRDADAARGSDLAEVDASQLRIARQQLHQAVGALEMVGLGAPAKVLRAMEALAQKFVQRPELCSEDAAHKVERASAALTEYLEGVLKGRKASSVALFPQYRDVVELVGGDRIHPADLWAREWRWIDAPLTNPSPPLAFDPAVRSRMDQSVLKLVRSTDEQAAKVLTQISLGLAAHAQALEPRVFWKLSAAFFEAVGQGLCPADVYVKRTASRIIAQYATLAKGEPGIADRLAQDLLFYCAQSAPGPDQSLPVLKAVRAAYGLTASRPVPYEQAQFGRFDPATLAQARKRVASAAETWATLAGGDTNRMRTAVEQFGAVSESMVKLHPETADLARALTRALDMTARSGEPPPASVAMEVATSVLYLEAAYEDLDPTETRTGERSARLAQRLEAVLAGAAPEPMEGWMEELYRRVSDRQTMGSVVDELRTTLGQVEKALDQFFRNPADRVPLHEVPSQLAQMRGVFSVLGLDQPSLASMRMRESVENFLVDQVDPQAAVASGVFDKLGNSLSAMGFLIDMLSYQRALAKKLFVYDEEAGELKPVMGREVVEPDDAELPGGLQSEDAAVAPAGPAAAATPEAAPGPVPVEAAEDDEDAEMRGIFLDEAREVIGNGQQALQALASTPGDLSEQTTLRRAFHTLKGSSRMVGLNDFGEAAWSFEQLLNTWLAEQKPAGDDLLSLCKVAMRQFAAWVEDIANDAATPWSSQSFRKAADALRLDHQLVDLAEPGAVIPQAPVPAPAVIQPEPQPEPADAAPQLPTPVVLPEPAVAAEPAVAVEPVGMPEPVVTLAPVAALLPDPEPEPEREAKADAEAEAFDTSADVDFPGTQLAAFPVEAARGEFAPTELAELPRDSGAVDAPDSMQPEFSPTQMQPASSALPKAPAAPELDLGDFDFGDLGAVGEEASKVPSGAPDAELLDAGETLAPPELPDAVVPAEPMPPSEAMGLADAEVAAQEDALALERAQALPPSADSDEQVKVIGDLRIGIPLYNVYLNEADEWSRRLLTELSEWELELHQPLRDSTIGLAHSLGGSSATVGFRVLSEAARLLELTLQHVQLHRQGTPAFARTFLAAAEDIRRLLHQFAAGFLKDPDPTIQPALQSILDTAFDSEVPASISALPEDASPEPAAVDEPPAAAAAATGAARLVVVADETSDAVDRLDADLFPIFEDEGADLFPQLGGALRQWVARPDNLGARNEALRVLHTLKGSARLSGAMRLGEMAHRLESAIESLGGEPYQGAQLEPMLGRYDALQAQFDGLRRLAHDATGKAADTPIAPTLAPAPVATGAVVAAPAATSATADAPAVPAAPAPLVAAPAAQVVERRNRARAGTGTVVGPKVAGQTVRVSAQLLDRLVNQAGEVIITRSRLDGRLGQMRSSLKELAGNLERLRQQLREIEVQAESQMQSRMAQTKDHAQNFDPLEFDRFTRVQELTRIMAESVSDVATVQRNLQRTMEGTEDDLIAQARQARELQRDLLRTRMVEFEGISERLYGVVRQAAKETGRQVKLDIVGGSLDLDRGVLERMAPAFEHLLRNAVAHGIEDPAIRAASGKPATGTITITLRQEGNDVSVEFADDGAGLQLDRIRARAIANGLVAADAVLGDDELARLLFAPGFSTTDKVTELAGRGIGLDVVRSEVDALGGRIETATRPGAGTTFTVVVPLTTAVTQVVMLRLGDLSIGVPSNLVEVVRRVSSDEVRQAYAAGSVEHDGEAIPLYWAGALLQHSGTSVEQAGKHLPIVVFRSAGRRVAAHVDEVLGNQEVVVKNLGPQLARVPGLTGMSVLASGAVVLIYNPVALAAVHGEQARSLQSGAISGGVTASGKDPLAAPAGAAPTVPLVLVVDDSITVRRVTQRLLKREGYRVTLAADGLQALERLQDELPSVVLSDIEMPRMDGFDLARNIRDSERLRHLPIIMITSRIAEKHREHARELGVDHYLGKPYGEDELLGLVRHYCALPASTDGLA